MELRHLKYFLTVAKELNFTKAAEKLFISQPPLSRQIKELEEELGARLFDRTNKSVQLTDAGKYFKTEVSEIMTTLEAVKLKTLKISENLSGDYHIAYISSTFSSTISNLVEQLTEKYPYLNIKLYELSTAKQITALEQGKLDLGILRAPVISTRIEVRRWFQDSYSVVFNKNHVNIIDQYNLDKLKDEVFVFYNKEYAPAYYNSLIEICARYGFTPNIVHESNNINSIIQLVQNGLGVSIVPSSLAESNNNEDLRFIELNENDLFTEVLVAIPKKRKHEITDTAIDFLTK